MTLVSIIVGTHSAKRLGYLREAMSSVRAQTHTETEILLWDNGHDESLRAFAEEQVREDPRIRYHRHEPSVSAGANFNSALQASRGEYVVMLGDDDRLLPHAIEAELAAKQPDTVVTFGNLHIIDSDGKRQPAATQGHQTTFGRDRLPPGRVTDPIGCAWQNTVFLPGSLMRTRELKRYGVNSTVRAGDFLLFVQLAADGHSFLHVENYLVEYRVHPGSVTVAGSVNENEGLFALLEPIQVPPHVEPIKRSMLGGLLVAMASEFLRAGDVAKARALMREPYYPALRDQPGHVAAQALLTMLPSKIARSSALAVTEARRWVRAVV